MVRQSLCQTPSATRYFRREIFFLAALFILAIIAANLHATLCGEFIVWAGVLDTLNLRGDERILDMGCGRGAVLLLAGQHLTTGRPLTRRFVPGTTVAEQRVSQCETRRVKCRAVGVDLWRSVDQSGNSAEATRRNAVLEGVADRVELHTGDMTALPFEDSSFDVVLSSLTIHNIRGNAGRAKAVSEAVRVLRPGGRLLLVRESFLAPSPTFAARADTSCTFARSG